MAAIPPTGIRLWSRSGSSAGTRILAAVYERKVAHIDADGSGACETGEPVYLDSALIQAGVTLPITPDDIRLRPAPAGFCDTLGGFPAN